MKLRLMTLALLTGLIFAAVPASAQTYLTSTTLTGAVSDSQTFVPVASASGIAAGGALFINHEVMNVVSVSGLRVNVTRGSRTTRSTAHANAATVVIIPAAAINTVLANNDPGLVGQGAGAACTASAHTYLPVINVQNGNVWLCRAITSGGPAVWAGTNTAPLTYNSLLLTVQ